MTPLRPAPAAVLVALLALPAAAHEKQVHSDLIDTAFQIILAAENPSLFAGAALPPGVTQADAEALRVAMVHTPERFARLPFDAGEPFAPCDPNGAQPSKWQKLGDADAGMSIAYKVGAECIDSTWSPGGILDAENQNKRMRFMGPALGYLAAHADDEYGDSTLYARPTNAGVMLGGFIPIGPGPVVAATDAVLDLGLTAIFAPIVCIADFIRGNGNCLSHAADIADTANPVDDLASIIPGLTPTNQSNETLVGLWHHINLGPRTSNEYDDTQGYLLDEAGLYGCPDALETVLIAAGDLTGMSINHAASNGPRRYTLATPNDGLPATRKRTASEWESHTVSHTAMEPLDNLAYYGWSQFRSGNHPTQMLEWPLHAIGDAVSPMHTIGSPGWGHHPFELSIERDWRRVRFLSPADPASERAQVKRIFTAALKHRKLIVDWRRAHSSPDVPIRQLITALARETYDSALLTTATVGWPFNALASTDHELHGHSAFYDRDDNAALVRPLIENGIGAAIALLVSASEVVEVLP